MTLAILYGNLSMITILSNTLLIYTLCKTKQLDTISNRLMLVMNVSDLCLGFVGFPTLAAWHSKRDILTSCIFDKAVTCILILFSKFSIFMLFCISIDRYFRVTKMNRYNLFMNEFRMRMMIFSSFILASLLALMAVLCASFSQHIAALSVGISFILSAIVVYVYLLRKLRIHIKQFQNGNGANSGSESRETTRNQLSATKTIQLLLLYLIITYTPYHITSCLWTYYKFHRKAEPNYHFSIFYAWSSFLVLLNASGNSWIIIYGNKQSRRFVSSLFTRNTVAASSDD